MTVRGALQSAARALEEAGVPDARLDAEYLLSHVLETERMRMLLMGENELTQEQERRFSSLLLSRARRVPLQYLLGEQVFYGLRFRTDRRALIPRPETEELCEWGLALLKGPEAPRVLDLCTGSGAIAVTLARECPKACVFACDLSADALALARENARRNAAEVVFLQGDLWDAVDGQSFDLIVSNPPYIPSADCASLQPEVRFEPLMALDGGADGLDFYRRIARGAMAHLLPGGWLVMEVGAGEADAVARLLTEEGLEGAAVRKDLSGVPRMVGAFRRRESNV